MKEETEIQNGTNNIWSNVINKTQWEDTSSHLGKGRREGREKRAATKRRWEKEEEEGKGTGKWGREMERAEEENRERKGRRWEVRK